MTDEERKYQAMYDDIIERLGGEPEAFDALKDVSNHGAEGGFPGFTYYTETSEFYREHEDAIWQLLYEDAEDQGLKHPLELIATFNGAKDVQGGDQFENLLAWYALERVAHDYVNEKESTE